MKRERRLSDNMRFSGEVVHSRTGEVYAVGELAFVGYYKGNGGLVMKSNGKHLEGEAPPPDWYVERLYRGVWITAGRMMQGRTIEEARRLAAAFAGHRVVMRTGVGSYKPAH